MGQPYSLLLWEIGCVQACPIHRVNLVSDHRCGPDQAISPLRIKPLPHLCRNCGRSLALPPSVCLQPAETTHLAFARAIGELLASSLFSEVHRDSNRTIADFLFDVVQSNEYGRLIQAARRIEVSKGEVSDWIHRCHLPSLHQAARIANAYGGPLSEILVGKGGDRLNPKHREVGPYQMSLRPCYSHPLEVGDLEARLHKFLTSPIPPSEARAAHMVGTSSRELRRLHPELARALAERHAAWCEQESTRRCEEGLRVVEALISQMICEGVVPTMAKLEERLVGISKAFLFQYRAECKQLCELAISKLRVSTDPTPEGNGVILNE